MRIEWYLNKDDGPVQVTEEDEKPVQGEFTQWSNSVNTPTASYRIVKVSRVRSGTGRDVFVGPWMAYILPDLYS